MELANVSRRGKREKNGAQGKADTTKGLLTKRSLVSGQKEGKAYQN